MNDVRLLRPSIDLYDQWVDCVRAYAVREEMNGSGWWWIEGFGPDRASCAAMVAKAEELTTAPPEGLVVSDCYWIAEGGEIIGFLMLRRSLDNEFLRTQGGHIGYSIRPDRRRQGHASRALGLALAEARAIGLDRVLITCEAPNVASARTIESQGGRFEGFFEDKRRYWINL
jgi:predicted acetyltransferase